jgi:hypothetical protein
MLSASDSPEGAGSPLFTSFAMLGGVVPGMLTWMPSSPSGAWTAMTSERMAPQSPPWDTWRWYPRRRISSCQARPTWSGPQPVPGGFPEKP